MCVYIYVYMYIYTHIYRTLVPHIYIAHVVATGVVCTTALTAHPRYLQANGYRLWESHFGRYEDLRTDNTTNKNTDQVGAFTIITPSHCPYSPYRASA